MWADCSRHKRPLWDRRALHDLRVAAEHHVIHCPAAQLAQDQLKQAQAQPVASAPPQPASNTHCVTLPLPQEPQDQLHQVDDWPPAGRGGRGGGGGHHPGPAHRWATHTSVLRTAMLCTAAHTSVPCTAARMPAPCTAAELGCCALVCVRRLAWQPERGGCSSLYSGPLTRAAPPPAARATAAPLPRSAGRAGRRPRLQRGGMHAEGWGRGSGELQSEQLAATAHPLPPRLLSRRTFHRRHRGLQLLQRLRLVDALHLGRQQGSTPAGL